jgi:GH43 family beta-xylosidase
MRTDLRLFPLRLFAFVLLAGAFAARALAGPGTPAPQGKAAPQPQSGDVSPVSLSASSSARQHPRFRAPRMVRLPDERLRDPGVFADAQTRTYYLVSAVAQIGPNGRPAVAAYVSKDLAQWEGPHIVFETPEGFWGNRGIWAPELHAYRGKYYLFLTFNTDDPFPEQWRDWLPRVKRGSQVLVADSPLGPFKPFANESTLPADMMTLDGTLWIEDGAPYMVFCHEWVQIKDGTVESVRLSDDLSRTIGEPVRLFNGSDAPWSKKSGQYGCHVTDGCWLYRTKTGRLLMLWSTGGARGYTTGIAVSQSGKLAGPWTQQPEPIYTDDGGHAMLFQRFDGQLMMALHSPNKPPHERVLLLEMEDLGDTLRVRKK